MPLTCGCDYEVKPGDTVYYHPNDYSILPGSRRKRCTSCHDFIKPGGIVIAFKRFKVPKSEVEVAIYGEEGEVPKATHYHCEECADLWFSLYELGFECISSDENVRNLSEEYAEAYGPNPIHESLKNKA